MSVRVQKPYHESQKGSLFKNVFVTGATGFIGSHLLRQFANAGGSVVAQRRAGSFPRIDLGVEPQWLEKPLDQVTAEDFADVDVLIHLASVGVSPLTASWSDLFYWNVAVFVRLMEQAKLAGVRRLVVAGSFAEYGRSADAYDLIPTNAPLLPTSPYASSKTAAFSAAHAFSIQHDMELCYLRIFSAFGEGQNEENFWPALKNAAHSGQDFKMTSGEQIRDYVPVESVAGAFIKNAFRVDVKAGTPLVLNIGTGNAVTMKDFALEWWHRLNAKGNLQIGALPYRSNEVMRFVPKIEKVCL